MKVNETLFTAKGKTRLTSEPGAGWEKDRDCFMLLFSGEISAGIDFYPLAIPGRDN
jgi:hypothetical protein